MLRYLGDLIVKRPWFIITVIILITIGFSVLLPSIEMKTDFREFSPEDETVDAFWRVTNTFGQSKLMMFLYVEKLKADGILSAGSLREMQYIQNELLDIEIVESSLSLITVIDQICFVEFGKTIENCTDDQILIAVNDLLGEDFPKSIKVFDQDDPNEKVDFNRFPRLSKGKSIDEIDIKNCYVEYNDESFTFSFEVYDLKSFESKIKSPIPFNNVVEWYMDFENIIRPDPMLDIDYKITAHIEPKHSIWEIGKGPLKNIKSIFQYIRNRELFNSYKKEAYLWIKAPEMPFYFPIKLETANVQFDTGNNRVDINVSRDELGKYGIALKYSFIELPAKITNFKAGTRYYQSPIFKLPWSRVTANTSFLFKTLDRLINRPILGDITNRLFKKFANFSYEDFDELFEQTDEFISLPDQVALKDLEQSWINCDISPDESCSKNQLFVRTSALDDLKVSILGLISDDYEKTKNPIASIMILNINLTLGWDEQISATQFLIDKIEEIDSVNNEVKVTVTGDSVISVQLNEVTTEANMIIVPMIIIMIIIVLFISFRSVSYVILPLVALVISTIWIFGLMVLLDITFTTLSVAIIPLVLGLGVDYSVHLLHHYRLELSKGLTPAKAIKRSVLEIGTAMFLAMITTVIAFLSFLSASIPPLRDLGILLSLGIFFTFITAITLQASVRYILDRKKKEFTKIVKKSYKLNIFMGQLAKFILKNQKKIIVIIVVITALSGLWATQIETGFDLYSFLPEDNPAMNVFGKIQEDFPYVGQVQEYILLEGDVDSVKAIRGIKKTHENLKDDTFVTLKADGTANAESIYTIILQAVNNNESMIEDFNLDENTKLPKTDKDVNRLYTYLWENPEYGIQTHISLNKTETGGYNAALIRVFVSIASTTKQEGSLENDLQVLYDEFQDDLVDYGDVKATATGQWIITNKITSELTESQMISTAIALILATLVIMIAYKRFTLGLIVIIPVLISIVWILGTMSFIGYSLDVLTITVTSLTIGIGIDYAIHATERFRLVADKTGNVEMAVTQTIEKTGGALLIAAITTILGFGMLIFAPIPPQAQFGVIMVMTIAYSLITSLSILPFVLSRWAKWTKKRKGYIISDKPVEKDYIDELNNDNK